MCLFLWSLGKTDHDPLILCGVGGLTNSLDSGAVDTSTQYEESNAK